MLVLTKRHKHYLAKPRAGLGDEAPPEIAAEGDLGALGRQKAAFLASDKETGSVILAAYGLRLPEMQRRYVW